MDVETVLLSVQERDNWRRRLELLEKALAGVRESKRRVEVRLRRLKRELSQMRHFADNAFDQTFRASPTRTANAAHTTQYPSR
jgi:hypothetical protein